jgi:hypothetical protein
MTGVKLQYLRIHIIDLITPADVPNKSSGFKITSILGSTPSTGGKKTFFMIMI